MKHYIVKKQNLHGNIQIPASKSHTLRALLFGAMGNKKTVIHNPLFSNDSKAMIDALKNFGASFEIHPNRIEITGVNGKITSCDDVLNAHNSGIVLRFCTAIGALSTRPVVVTGDPSIRNARPIQPLLDGLNQLGVRAESLKGNGFAPVLVQGPIKSGIATISGEDSQPVSGLLIACSFANGPFQINVQNPGEKPWVALTLNWFDRLGISYKHSDFSTYSLAGHSRYDGFEYTVPGDLSSSAYSIGAALVTQSELTIKNVDMNDCQGDKELISVFQQMGAHIEIDEQNKTVHVKKTSALSGITVDINNFVDAITILSVVACFAEGETHIKNAAIAKQKECNRIMSIARELKKMNAHITPTIDGLIIKKSSLQGAEVFSYNDHRMAMSLAVAGLGADGETLITSIECVAKTYPTFVSDFNKIGADIKETL